MSSILKQLALPSNKTVSFATECTVHIFEREHAPNTRMQVQATEQLVEGDLRNFHAARAVDILLRVAVLGGLKYVNMFGQSHLARTLETFHEVSTEPMTSDELKSLVREQLTDLVQRCDARMTDLGGKFNPKQKMELMANATTEEEQDMLTRTPDVLMQRYLRHSVNSKDIGLPVNRALARAMQVLLAAQVLK